MTGEASAELSPLHAEQIRQANDRMADNAWRVLALAYKPLGRSAGILLASIYVPPMAGIFGMLPLSFANWAAILLSTIILSRIDDFLKDILYLTNLRKAPSFGV